MRDLPSVVTPDGVERRLGCLLPLQKASALPVYEETRPVLTWAEIEQIARDGTASGKRFADDDWVKDQRSHGSCFPPGTLIRMADGSQKPIEQIKLFDEVVTAEGNLGTVVTLFGKEEKEKLYHIKLRGHNLIRCTSEHPILTKRGYVAAENLTSNDYVAIPRYHCKQVNKLLYSEQYVKPSRFHVSKQKYVNKGVVGRRGISVAVVDIPDVVELNADVGYIFGLFLAEGNTDTSRVCWSFHRKEEDTLVKALREKLEVQWGVESHIQYRGANSIKVVVYGIKWAKLFEGLFGTGSGRKRVPAEICAGSREFLQALLEGWLHGDGHFRRNTWQGVTISKSLAVAMFDIGNMLGLNPTIRNYRAYLTHHVKTRQPRYEVTLPAYEDRTLKITESSSEVVWRKVHKIEIKAYSGMVYNFEVKGDNSYVADGVGVHNCNGYAGAMALSRARVLKGMRRVDLSGAYLYSLINGGRDNGSMLDDGMEAMQRQGVAPEEYADWDQIYPNRYRKGEADAAARKYRGFECYSVGTRNQEEARLIFYSGLALGFVGVVAVHVANRFMNVDTNGVAGVDKGPGNHAVGVEGISWRRNRVVEDGFNSWNLNYGARGRMGLTWDHHAGTFDYHQFYLIGATLDNPDDDNPPPVPNHASLTADDDGDLSAR